MAMTNQEQKELRSYCSFLMKENGFSFSQNDPIIPALYIIHKEMQWNIDNNKAMAAQIENFFENKSESISFQLSR
jgi:hypothetical protein